MTQITEIKESIKTAIDIIESQKAPGHILEETDFALALALEFPKVMNRKQGYRNIKFGGCYIHPSQIATIINAANNNNNAVNNNNTVNPPYQSCKLGDLLILVRKHSNEHVRYNAALIKLMQIKKTDTNPIVIMDPINQATLYLYRWWPVFSLASIGNKYNIYPKTVSQGALYCIIKPTRKKEWQFYMAEPMQQMTYDSQMTLARFIRDAMNWQTGRAISNEADSGSDGWSKLIWDLIRQAEKTAVNRGVINYSSPSSLSDNFLHLMLEKQGIDISVPMDGINQSNDDVDGMSILFIDIDGCEGEQEN